MKLANGKVVLPPSDLNVFFETPDPLPTASSVPPKPNDATPLVLKLLDPGAPPRRELRDPFREGPIDHFEADICVASLKSLDTT